jgi:UPF0716 protein FxsA
LVFVFVLIVILLLLWPIVELIAVIEVAGLVGVPLTILLLILGSVAGWFLLRHQGRAAWRRFNDAARSGKTPTREVVDGALVVTGGLLLLIPGFVTDVFGLLLLFPPTRWVARWAVLTFAMSNFVVRVGTTAYGGASSVWQRRGRRGGDPPQGGASVPPAERGYDVEGTAVEVDQRTLGT